MARHGPGHGYHYLVFDWWHTPAGCNRCAALAAYADRRGALVATVGDRVAVLRAGSVRLPTHRLPTLLVDVHAAHEDNLPAITAPMWVAAAAVLAGVPGPSLATALTCAAGLYTPAARP